MELEGKSTRLREMYYNEYRMKKKQSELSKKDLVAIERILTDAVERVMRKFEKMQEKNELLLKENKKIAERFDTMILKMEKMHIQNELLYASYLHAMELINVYKEKVLELEKRLPSSKS